MGYMSSIPDPHELAALLLERLTGVTKAGRDAWRATCPVHRGRTGALSIRVLNDKLLIHCFGKCERDAILSAVGLEDLFRSRRATSLPHVSIADVPVRDVEQTRRLEAIWARGLEIKRHTPPGRYLRVRGIGINAPELDALRWVPNLDYWDGEVKTGSYPAIVGRLEAPGVGLVALLRVYLHATGTRLATVPDAKKTTRTAFPSHPIRGAAVALYPGTGGKVAVAEGLITAIACRELLGNDWAIYAAGDAGRLEAFQAPPDTESLWIMADNDSNQVGQRAAEVLASRYPGIAHVRIPEMPTGWTGKGFDWLDYLRARKELPNEL